MREGLAKPTLPHNQTKHPGESRDFTAVKLTSRQAKSQQKEIEKLAASTIVKDVHTGEMKGVTEESVHSQLNHFFEMATPAERGAGARWYADALDFAKGLHTSHGADLGLSLDEVTALVAATSVRNAWDDHYGTADQKKTGNQALATKVLEILKENPRVEITADQAATWKKTHGQDISRYIGKTPIRELPSDLAIRFLPARPNPLYREGGNIPATLTPWGGLTVGVAQAMRIYRGESIDEAMSGSKIRSFYRNIRSAQSDVDDQDVTIDSWMLRAIANKTPSGSASEKAAIEDAQNDLISNEGKYKAVASWIASAARAKGMKPKEYQAVVWLQYREKIGLPSQKVARAGARAAKAAATKAEKAEMLARARGRKKKSAQYDLSWMVRKDFSTEYLDPRYEPTEQELIQQEACEEFWARVDAHLRGEPTDQWNEYWGRWNDEDDEILDWLLS